MNRNLIMVTKMFPYGKQEPFIENEIVVASKKYNRILIIAYQVSDLNMREIPPNVTVLPLIQVNRTKKIFYYLRDAVKGCLSGELLRELKKVNDLKEKRKVFSFYCEVCLKERQSRSFLNSFGWDGGSYTFYSYWLLEPAYLTLRLRDKYMGREKAIFVSRAHGYDLYKERNNGKEFPFRETLLKNIDRVYVCSERGARYLEKSHPCFSDKITYSYLGTKNVFRAQQYISSIEKISIVTCSNLIPVKRVGRLAEMLKEWENRFPNVMIQWNCFGDGIMRNAIEEYCRQNLKKTEVIFQGHRKNYQILQYYERNTVDLFINLSESEGVPVSLMEASSYGIPIIATDVGGTSEIVIDRKNGYLLNADFSNDELLDVMGQWYQVSEENKCEMRVEARRCWEQTFQAEKNYECFYDRVEAII